MTLRGAGDRASLVGARWAELNGTGLGWLISQWLVLLGVLVWWWRTGRGASPGNPFLPRP